MQAKAEQLAQRAVDYFGALQKPQELRDLVELVQKAMRPGWAILEIGCDAGGTLFTWHRLAGFVIGVDLPNGNFGTGRRLFDYGALVIRADSHDPATLAKVVKHLAGRPVGLLFIDGDHTYDGVKADYRSYGGLVTRGGLIALHDICEHPPEPPRNIGVARFWREIRYTAEATEIVYPPTDWGGIGVIHVA